jgi:serine/threonine-protein kinase HipA
MNYLTVEFEGDVVGRAHVDARADEFAFSYDEAWLDRPDSFPISVPLPLRRERWPAERAHIFFANLLPEGQARQAICDRLGISPDNDVALLAELGDDTAGAFRFVPNDGHEESRFSLAGAQHKTSVVLTSDGYAQPASDEPSTHILKFDSPDFPHLTANEFLTTRFAAELGLDTVTSTLDDRTSPPVFVIERFDRRSAEQTTRRLHQEDFCQILGYRPAQKYESDGGPGLGDVASAIRHYSGRPAADVLELVRWVIFCALSGNADGHAKNLSMFYGPSGLSLAPAYDLVCTRAYPRIYRGLAFSVGGQRNPDRLRAEEWESLAETLGVNRSLVLRQVESLTDEADAAFGRACDQLRAEIGESHAIQHVSKAVRKRVRAIRSHLEP